jgi:hypothetical protein
VLRQARVLATELPDRYTFSAKLASSPDNQKPLIRRSSMTAEEFAEGIDRLIVAARDGGLSDAKMIVVLEAAVEELDEGLSADC